jgi:3-oxoacid CoA-transferase B subunit
MTPSAPQRHLPRRAGEAESVIAKRIAQELCSGMLVNLGIGIPTLVANFLPDSVHVFFQSENGLIGTESIPEEGMAQPVLTDAGGRSARFPAPASSTAPCSSA